MRALFSFIAKKSLEMPVRNDNALYHCRLHPTNGEKGFSPYEITVKNSDVYIQGESGELMHISLHSRESQKDNDLAQCHMAIPLID